MKQNCPVHGEMPCKCIVEPQQVAASELNALLSCRIRKVGETMESGDIVLISDTFMPLGFSTEFDLYFAGQLIDNSMSGKVICKAR